MNKRARQRLIGVTVLILVAIGGLVFIGGGFGAATASVEDVASDPELVGERVSVGGLVVADSWDQETRPMEFDLRDKTDQDGTGSTIHVIYDGGTPTTFGDDVEADVKGVLVEPGVVEADELMTSCPSKYTSAADAYSVSELLGNENVLGRAIEITGVVADGSVAADGFVLEDEASGDTVDVSFTGALPENVGEGTQVVVGGSLGEDGVFKATSVAEAAEE